MNFAVSFRLILRFALVLGWAASSAVLMASEVSDTPASEAAETVFDQIMEHYEVARQSLLFDRTDDVVGQGRAIGDALRTLEGAFSTERAGIAPEHAEAARMLLPELIAAADALAQAEELTAMRNAFYALSKPLVRYRAMTSGDRPIVGYCPMAKKSWLQPRGTLGNPYHGQAMAECGSVVDG